MQHTIKGISLNMASPRSLATFSYALFLFAWLFPPDLYTYYLGEPDLVFFNMQCLSFYTLCYLAFIVGATLFRQSKKSQKSDVLPNIQAGNSFLYLGIPLMVACVVVLFFLNTLLEKMDLVGLLFSLSGSLIKQATNAGEVSDTATRVYPNILIAAIWWATYRRNQVELVGFARTAYNALYCFSVFLAIATTVATVSRGYLFSVISGLYVIRFYWSGDIPPFKLGRRVIPIAAGGICLILVFNAISLLRGIDSGRFLIANLLGYSIASYNRLAALLSGQMLYATAHKGVYLVDFFSTSSTINNLTHIRTTFNWPTAFDIYLSEFAAARMSGLNSSYIWSGVFGYLYSDLGWLAPVYMFFIGLLVNAGWKAFRVASTWGIVFYPWFGFSILFWIGSNVIFNTTAVTLLGCWLLLVIYEAACSVKLTPAGTERQQEISS